jgi:hypothetical protein
MRRFEKKQNIAKANILTEQRYLESKGLIKEYDIESVDRNYSRLPDDRKKNVKDFLTKRQLDQGYVLKSVEGGEFNLFLTRDDINGITPIMISDRHDTGIFKNVNGMVKLSKSFKLDRDYNSWIFAVRDEYKFDPYVIFDTSKRPLIRLKENIKCKFTTSMNHLMTEIGDTISMEVELSGVLMKENDDYYPPFTLIINSIKIGGNNKGYVVPADNEGKKFIIDKITSLVKEKYKYKGYEGNDIFIKTVKVDRNSFYK